MARAFETQFYCGPHLLVMPVLNANGDVEGYLPEHDGGWHELWSGMHVDGGEVVSFNYDFERIPVFVKAGVALPVGPVVQSTRPLEGLTPVVAVAEFGRSPQAAMVSAHAATRSSTMANTGAVTASVSVTCGGLSPDALRGCNGRRWHQEGGQALRRS